MSAFSIHHIVQRCLAGDEAAMLELVEQFQGPVFGLCYRMLGQRQDAEDAAQETFVRVLRHLAKWDPSREFEPWLLAIAGNRCRTALARRSRAPRNEPLAEDRVEDATQETQAAELLAEEVRLALEQVRPEYREAFLLFHDHERSYLEIAEIMDAPVGTIKTWVHRARKELVSRLHRRSVIQDRRHAVRTV
ncbi:MAG: sigma-70 family RNA polymerase sigma factor [Planctomycetales bacterium]|nr:sigma-70 family RNA polymerase sigma factor [Planctomycetales bacterium]